MATNPMSEKVGEALARLAEFLRLKPSQAKRLELLERELSAKLAKSVDELENLKEDIRRLEERALRKKQEADAARGGVKRVVIEEIRQIFRNIDRLKGREEIITRNIDRISMARDKLRELAAAQAGEVPVGTLDDLAVYLEESIENMKESDREARDLERTRYEAAKQGEEAVEDRLAELSGEGDKKEAQEEIPEEIAKRLKELET